MFKKCSTSNQNIKINVYKISLCNVNVGVVYGPLGHSIDGKNIPNINLMVWMCQTAI